jgi:hypothetical protein
MIHEAAGRPMAIRVLARELCTTFALQPLNGRVEDDGGGAPVLGDDSQWPEHRPAAADPARREYTVWAVTRCRFTANLGGRAAEQALTCGSAASGSPGGYLGVSGCRSPAPRAIEPDALLGLVIRSTAWQSPKVGTASLWRG